MGNHSGNGKRETITLPKIPKPNVDGRERGVVTVVGDRQLPREYITAGLELDEAAVRTIYVDENENNDVTRLYAKLTEFNVASGLDTLRFWLNGRRAVNGKALIYSLMGHTQIIAPEALGIRLSRRESEAIKRASDAKQKRNENEDQRPA